MIDVKSLWRRRSGLSTLR